MASFLRLLSLLGALTALGGCVVFVALLARAPDGDSQMFRVERWSNGDVVQHWTSLGRVNAELYLNGKVKYRFTDALTLGEVHVMTADTVTASELCTSDRSHGWPKKSH